MSNKLREYSRFSRHRIFYHDRWRQQWKQWRQWLRWRQWQKIMERLRRPTD